MADREELEHQIIAVLRGSGSPASVEKFAAHHQKQAAAIIDAIGLTEETVWTDDGDPNVQHNTPAFSISGDPFDPAPQEFFREHGWKMKRRWVSPWEDITDD